jgi:nitronate monooxygenase
LHLPDGDAQTMNFGGGQAAKAWRDIWGAGQGIGAVSCSTPGSTKPFKA